MSGDQFVVGVPHVGVADRRGDAQAPAADRLPGRGSCADHILPRGIGLATDDTGGHHIFQQLSLGVGDPVHGLVERFGPIVKNGSGRSSRTARASTSGTRTAPPANRPANIPFFLTNARYWVLVNRPERVSFEVGSEAVSRTQLSLPGEYLEYFVIHGPTPKQVLSGYIEA